jgi:(E)-4-hydroxy-3-methylbut-2-enyl-diphosphate synthase
MARSGAARRAQRPEGRSGSRSEILPSFPRRRTRRIFIGRVPVGGGAPIAVQSMTKTDTRDVRATLAQIRRLRRAGCEIVRLAVPDPEAARALVRIKKEADLPLVADIHFDHRLALAALQAGVDGLRINPGNIGSRDKVREVAAAAKEREVPIRVGVNSGSLEKDLLRRSGGRATARAMVDSALRHVRLLEDLDFHLIKISLKASDVRRTLAAYRLLARRVDYPFHAGITEAGGLLAGSVKSAAGLALLLAEGLADTIRVSLTAPPEEEVRTAFRILAALDLRRRGPVVISCPTCGRSEADVSGAAAEVEKAVAGLEAPLTVAVMGCMVNGPGEAREADIGLAFGRGKAAIFRRGRLWGEVRGRAIVREFVGEVRRLAKEAGRGRT